MTNPEALYCYTEPSNTASNTPQSSMEIYVAITHGVWLLKLHTYIDFLYGYSLYDQIIYTLDYFSVLDISDVTKLC